MIERKSYIPQEQPTQSVKKSNWQQFAKAGQAIGGFASMFNPAVGGAIAGASTLGGMMLPKDKLVTSQPDNKQAVGGIDTSGAVERRMGYQQEDPRQAIADATITLNDIDIPIEQKRKLLNPLLQAQSRFG